LLFPDSLATKLIPPYFYEFRAIDDLENPSFSAEIVVGSMEAKINRFFDSVGSFFSGNAENIPWCDHDIIAVTFHFVCFFVLPYLA
jgi:hypothetical protein